jgi:hypothetical protein
VFFAFVVGIVVRILLAVRYVKRISAMWQAAAANLGLDYTYPRLGMPRMSGEMRGRQVVGDVFRQGSGKNSQTFTR